MCSLLRFIVLLAACVAWSSNAVAREPNLCRKGDVPEALLGQYLPASELSSATHTWAPYRGYIYVKDETTITVSLTFDKDAFKIIRLNNDFALEIDIVDKDDILNHSWQFDFVDGLPDTVIVKKDSPLFDTEHQLSLLVLRPQNLEEEKEYKIDFKLRKPINQTKGRLKLNLQLVVPFHYSGEPFCFNALYNGSNWQDPLNYFKLQTEEYSAFWYTRGTTTGVCWQKRSDQSAFRHCVSRAGGDRTGDIVLIPDSKGNVGIAGPGIRTLATDMHVAWKPDFIVRKAWLETPYGAETYIYGSAETVKMKARFENVGRGNASSSKDIEVRFYLSKGYKEDAHSEWKRVGTDFIKPSNLKVGQTHTETEGLEINKLISSPGIYNIVACIDRIRDRDNGGGAHEEEHESNNCSTEAVFEVKPEAIVNVPQVDFIVTVIQLANTGTPVPAGGPMGARMAIRNIGSAAPTTGIRSAYEVCGPLPSTGCRVIADDGSDANELTPGRDQWEEIKSLVSAPSVPGTYYLCGNANYQATVRETNHTNNRGCIPFEVAALSPSLSIVKFQDRHGCCTTNRGKDLEPNIWVRNDGRGVPRSNVRVLYQVNSPGTGGQWWTMGYGTIEPRELPPGGTDEDYMDPKGWQIPKTSAWKKQWHTVRACLNRDGNEPTGDPSRDVCATYTRYSKE